jgi:hypothetical protein
MPQLLDRPQISSLHAIPTDLLEQEALKILNVSIDDLETRCDHVIPQGDVRPVSFSRYPVDRTHLYFGRSLRYPLLVNWQLLYVIRGGYLLFRSQRG